MGSRWTVTPEVIRYDLAWRDEKFWIEVKSELNNSDRNRIRFAGIKLYQGSRDSTELDLERAMFEKVRVWLLDWSLMDDANEKLSFADVETLRALRCEVFDVIDTAITKHSNEVDVASKKASTPQTKTADLDRLVTTSSS